jgi:hypothetical protein
MKVQRVKRVKTFSDNFPIESVKDIRLVIDDKYVFYYLDGTVAYWVMAYDKLEWGFEFKADTAIDTDKLIKDIKFFKDALELEEKAKHEFRQKYEDTLFLAKQFEKKLYGGEETVSSSMTKIFGDKPSKITIEF